MHDGHLLDSRGLCEDSVHGVSLQRQNTQSRRVFSDLKKKTTVFHLFKVYTRIRSQSVTWTIREVEMGKERDVEVREKSAVYSGIGDLIHSQFSEKQCALLCA